MSLTPIIATLQGTPIWVWLVLAMLILLGWRQLRPRHINRRHALILPLAMLSLSAYGVLATFGCSFITVSSWLLASLVALVFGVRYFPTQAQRLTPELFLLQGSWWPLVGMLAIFALNYLLGYGQAREMSFPSEPIFVIGFCVLQGALSGAFLARSRFAWSIH